MFLICWEEYIYVSVLKLILMKLIRVFLVDGLFDFLIYFGIFLYNITNILSHPKAILSWCLSVEYYLWYFSVNMHIFIFLFVPWEFHSIHLPPTKSGRPLLPFPSYFVPSFCSCSKSSSPLPTTHIGGFLLEHGHQQGLLMKTDFPSPNSSQLSIVTQLGLEFMLLSLCMLAFFFFCLRIHR